MGQKILAVRREWLLRLLRANDGKHARVTLPDDLSITDLQYEPLSQTILMTVKSEAWVEGGGDDKMVNAHIVYGD